MERRKKYTGLLSHRLRSQLSPGTSLEGPHCVGALDGRPALRASPVVLTAASSLLHR
jgi:hypothetical protein